MKNKNKSIFYIIVIALFMVFSVDKVFAVEPITVSIENNPGKLYVGKVVALRPKFGPTNSSSSVTWKSSNTSIATVDKSGNVKGIKPGNVVITVTTKNNKTSSVSIQVVDPKGTDSKKITSGFKISDYPKVMLPSTSGQVKVSNGKNVTYTSSNPDVISVDKKGYLSAKKIGSAEITAKNKSGGNDKVKIYVITMKFKQENFKVQQSGYQNIEVDVESSNDFNPILYSTIKWNTPDVSLVRIKNSDLKYNFNVKYGKNEYRNKYTYIAKVTGKEVGKSKLYFNLDGKSIFTNFNVTEYGQDYSLKCPTITYDMNDTKKIITLKISPASTTKLYTIETSSNRKTGSKANWTGTGQRLSGNKIFNYYYNQAQARITIFDANGKSRICYSAPFDVYYTKSGDNNKVSVSYDNNIKCPKMSPNISYINGFNSSKSAYVKLNDDNYNDEKYTGVSSVRFIGNINPKSNIYQYSWYDINNKEDKYFWDLRLKGTYSSQRNFILNTFNHETSGSFLAMNNKGDVRKCNTDNYSSSKYELIDTLGKTKVLKVNGESCSDYNQTKNILREAYKNAKYLFESGGKYIKYIVITHDGAWTGWNGPVISLPCDNPDIWIAPIHELSHAWDMMNNITGSKDNTTSKKTEYSSLMKKYKEGSKLGSKNLRTNGNIRDDSGCFYKYSWYYNQSYGPTMEFFAGLYPHYYFTKFHSKNEFDSMGMHVCWRWLLKNSTIPDDINNYINKTINQYNK